MFRTIFRNGRKHNAVPNNDYNEYSAMLDRILSCEWDSLKNLDVAKDHIVYALDDYELPEGIRDSLTNMLGWINNIMMDLIESKLHSEQQEYSV